MKRILTLVMIGSLLSCMSYKQYIEVPDYKAVPEGKKEIYVMTSLDKMKEVLQKNNIFYNEMPGNQGIITEVILIDEGTRAQYRIYVVQNETALLIVPYWGITDRVKSEIAIVVGNDSAQLVDDKDFKRVIYEKAAKRPKKVFDYGCFLASQTRGKVTLR